MVLKRVGVASAAKVAGVLYAVIGLIAGAIFSLFSLMGAALGSGSGSGLGGAEALIGVGAIFFMPIFYGVMGVIGGAIGAAVYNVIASMIGGIELELESTTIEAPPVGLG